MDGFVFIDKEPGYTSKDVSMKVGKLFHTTKVGHIGTLDPFASGLLIVMVNKATKSLICFEDFPKRYVATIKLGEYKDTMDIEGTTTETCPIPELNKEIIEKTLKKFLGKSMQTVPLTSAVHVNGKRLYEYAHRGQEVELPQREIEIFDIKFLDFAKDEITFETYVSKGTYIRALGADIAKELGKVKGDRKLVIFCAETTDLIDNALKKIKSKNADLVVANDVTKEGAGFDVDTNIVTICTKDGQVHPYDKMLKSEVANVILDEINAL